MNGELPFLKKRVFFPVFFQFALARFKKDRGAPHTEAPLLLQSVYSSSAASPS